HPPPPHHLTFSTHPTPPTALYTLPLHDALPISGRPASGDDRLVNALGSTMLAVFPEVYIIDTRFSNALLIGVNEPAGDGVANFIDRKSTRLNSSHVKISYAVFCLKKKILPFTYA